MPVLIPSLILIPYPFPPLQATGALETLVQYSQIEDVHVVVPCGASGHKFCVRVVVRDGALLLQVSTRRRGDEGCCSCVVWDLKHFHSNGRRYSYVRLLEVAVVVIWILFSSSYIKGRS